MPIQVKPSQNKQDFISDCISTEIKSGKEKEQAAAICYSSWNNAKKSNLLKSINVIKTDLLQKIEKEKEHELVNKYRDELEKAQTVEGYVSPEPGDLPKEGADLLAKVYAKCRADGGDKEKCSKIAWSATRNAGYKSAGFKVIAKNLEILKNTIQEKKIIKQEDMIPIKEDRQIPANNYFETLNYPAFLVSFPFNMSNEKQNNIWMEKRENKLPIDYNKAYTQWLDFYNTLVASGSLVYILPSQGDLQDEVYTANLGITLPSHIAKNTMILSNFRSEPRAGEEDVGRDFFNVMEFNIHQTPNFFEGYADLKYVKDNLFVGGYGIRTAIESYQWMMKQFDMQIIPVKMTDEHQYHFDCLFFPVNTENAIVCTEIISPEDLANIEKVINVIPVSKIDAYGGTTNSIRCGTQILNASSISILKSDDKEYDNEKIRVDNMVKMFGKLGFDVSFINMNEGNKSGAACSCLALPLNYVNIQKVKK
jgi:N-dimethylarginine dimethylaminohydrolase